MYSQLCRLYILWKIEEILDKNDSILFRGICIFIDFEIYLENYFALLVREIYTKRNRHHTRYGPY